jgi:hypothetical protein
MTFHHGFSLTYAVLRALLRSALIGLLLLPGLAQAAGVRILVQSSPLAGFQYHAGTVLWEQMQVGAPLDLIREPDNPHDPRAVRIDWQGHKLGYLPRKENAAVAAAIDSGERVEARIARLLEHKNPWQRVLIEVFVAL